MDNKDALQLLKRAAVSIDDAIDDIREIIHLDVSLDDKDDCIKISEYLNSVLMQILNVLDGKELDWDDDDLDEEDEEDLNELGFSVRDNELELDDEEI